MTSYSYTHKQVTIETDDGDIFNVDEGLEDIILTLNNWGFTTYLSCINNQDTIWIGFNSTVLFGLMMKYILKHRNTINKPEYVRETLWDFFMDKCDISVSYGEGGYPDENDEYWIDNGELDDLISMRFPVDDFQRFKELFFKVFTTSEKPKERFDFSNSHIW